MRAKKNGVGARHAGEKEWRGSPPCGRKRMTWEPAMRAKKNDVGARHAGD